MNSSGTLIRLNIRPGADANRVAAAASRALSDQVEDRIGVVLDRTTATAALRQEEWWGERNVAHGAVAETSAGETAPAEVPASERCWLLALVSGCGAVAFWLFWRRLRDPSAVDGVER